MSAYVRYTEGVKGILVEVDLKGEEVSEWDQLINNSIPVTGDVLGNLRDALETPLIGTLLAKKSLQILFNLLQGQVVRLDLGGLEIEARLRWECTETENHTQNISDMELTLKILQKN